MTSRLRFPVVPLLVLAVAAAARAAEPGPLGADTVRAASALRDRVAAGSRASEWVREITDRAGPRLAASDLTPVLCSLPQVNAATAFAASRGQRQSVGLHFDTEQRSALERFMAHARDLGTAAE